MTRWLGALCCLVLLLASAAHAATSDVPSDDGFGRLVVEWEAPVTISTGQRGETVEIRASRPFPARLEARLATLGPLLTSARLNETATLLALQPAPGVRVETATLDDRALTIALTSNDAPTLGLRLGRHAAFERIVIEPVNEHRVALQLDRSRVTLTLPGRLAAADRTRLEEVAGIERVVTAGNQLFLDLAPGAVVKPLFVGRDRQVLDVYPAATPAGAAARSTTAPIPSSAGAAAAPPPSAAVGPTTAAATDPPAAPLSVVATPFAHDAAPALGRVAAPWRPPSFPSLTIDAERRGGDTIEIRFTWPEPVPAAVFVRGDQLWVAFAAEHAGITLDAERFSAAARRFVTTLREESRPATTLIRLGLVEAPTVQVERQDSLWLVRLTATTGFGLDDSASEGSRPIESPTSGLVLPKIDAVAMLTDPIVGDKLGIGMALAQTGQTARPFRFVGLRLQPAAQGAVWQQLGEIVRGPQWTRSGLYLGVEEGVARTATGHPLPIPPAPLLETLPMALDTPLAPPHGATSQPAEVETDDGATIIQTATTSQSTAGDLAVASDVPVAMPAPSAVVGETGSLRPPVGATPPEAAAAGPLDLARFRAAPGRSFWDQRSRLLQAAESAGRQDDAVVEFELARLHIANGLGPEAMSILATLPEPGPLDGPATEWRALGGAARFLAGRYMAALDQLGHSALEADGETALWRGATRAALQQWDAALADWQRGEAWLAGYETVNQAALAEQGITLLLQTGRIDQAFALLEQTTAQALPEASAERLRELEAMALERDGAIDEARAIWRDLASTGSPKARSRALMSLTLADLETGRIEADAAIDRLVADSVHWRGQSDEIAKRRRLAAVQQAAGRVDDALATLQQALAGEPPADLAAAVTEDMTAIVETVFDQLTAGERSATATLLLYRRYAELVPRGRDGDARIEALAEALSDLGLDDAAVDSLRLRLAQSEVRDAGRAALGYALASILVRNGDRRGAMAALVDSTPIDPIDDHLSSARRELFASIGRAEEALPDGSEAPATTLVEQARRSFDRGDWPAVIEATTSLEPERPASGRLDAASTEIILMAATARRQLGDNAAVERLVARHGERLATASDDAVLKLLAGNARFRGAADAVLGEASSYLALMREAVAGMPSL